MKMIIVLICIFILSVSSLKAQVEAGDKEITFQGTYNAIVGQENYSSQNLTLFFSYGYFVSQRLQIGLGPTFRYTYSEFTTQTYNPFTFSTEETVQTNDEFDVSAILFFNYNFSTSGRTIPYFAAQYYQFTFDLEEEESLTDHAYINIGLGVRHFVSKLVALNASVNYGTSLNKDTEGGIILVLTGLSFFFR